MKKTLQVLILTQIIFFLGLVPLIAQDEEEEDMEFEEKMEAFGEKMEGLNKEKILLNLDEYEEQLEEYDNKLEEYEEQLDEGIITLPPMPPLPQLSTTKESSKQSVRLGLYLDDLDFAEAYERHYPHNYGVLVSGIVRGGNADRAGIIKGDIIMDFDDDKVRFEDHLISLRNSKSIGDTVRVTFFRNEKIMETDLIFHAPAPEVDEKGMAIAKSKKKKLHPGYGGGGPEAMYVDFDFSGLNTFLQANGFNNLTDRGLMLYGGGGMGNVGNGWFIGGMGAGTEKTQQDAVTDENGQKTGATRKYKLGTGFGGVTLVKKVPLFTNNVILDFGLMLGGGDIRIEVHETDGSYTWDDKISNGNNYALDFQKSFFAYRPSVGLLVKIKNWVGIHGSVGYMGAYSDDDTWTERNFNYTVDGSSPQIFNSLSYTIGFWFGS